MVIMAQCPKQGATVSPLRGTAIFTFGLLVIPSVQPYRPQWLEMQGAGQPRDDGAKPAKLLK
jgi:hypothetical protein